MAVDTIPDDVAQWTAAMLLVLGWNSKRGEQGQINTQNGNLLQAQANNPSPIIAKLRDAHADLANAYAANGVWNSTQEMQAAEIRATLAFETMPNQKPELQTGSANPTFWVKGARDPLTNEDREFIFKPKTPVSLMGGVEVGGEPIREALTGRVAEQLRAFTGLDFKMPLTNVISVDSTRLDAYDPVDGAMKLPNTPTQVGSLQQFSPSQGELRSHLLGARGNITAQSCQNVAILDTVTLNLDRHDGNLLLDQAGTGVVPIDHGLTMPHSGAVEKGNLGRNMAGDKNVVLRLAKSYEPFSQESLDGIGQIDPDLMQAALAGERKRMLELHPALENTMSMESLSISNLATKFLKAAAPSLPPAVLQAALGANAKELLDLNKSPQDRAQATQRIINEYQPKTAAIKQFWMMPADAREGLYTRLDDDGLLSNMSDDREKWLYDNIDLVLEYSRGSKDKPATPAKSRQTVDGTDGRAQIAQAFPKMKLPKQEADWLPAWNRILQVGTIGQLRIGLATLAKPEQLKTFDQVERWFRQYMEAQENKDRQGRLNAIATTFPQLAMPTSIPEQNVMLDAWIAVGRLGGMAAVRQKLTAQQPPKPAPRDPPAALLLLLAQPPDAKTQALKKLDYLDEIVALDNAIVSAQHQQAIAQARVQVNANQFQGDPVALIERLTNLVVAAAVPLIGARYTALKYRISAKEWEAAQNYLNLAYSGQIKTPVEYLHYLEGRASPNPIRT